MIDFNKTVMNFKSFITVTILLGLTNVICLAQITNHLTTCCESGTNYAIEKQECQTVDINEIIDIFIPASSVWHGLCLSTFDMCCSKELQNQNCIAGRDAAKSSANCDGLNSKYNKTSYTDCCKACQIGLAVAASGNNCSSNYFTYFSKDESFLICCNINNLNNINYISSTELTSGNTYNEKLQEEEEEEEDGLGGVGDNHKFNNNNNNNNKNTLGDTVTNPDTEDGTFVLSEGADICLESPFKLCSQICENTKDSYVCKCKPGYILEENNVTCTKLQPYDSQEDFDEDDDGAFEFDEDEDVDDDDNNFSDNESTCRRGFRRNEKSRKCEDTDECLETLNICSANQRCLNSKGSYDCINIKPTVCGQGYRYDHNTLECKDIDECLENICGKSNNFQCINYPGKYECRKKVSIQQRDKSKDADGAKCGAGFRFKYSKCIDIDECLTDKNACDTYQICTNEQGGYHCDCKIGFKMDSTLNACVDINECQINNHNCLPSQRCDNTLGSYTCIRLQSCGTGYTLNAESGNCDDDDECQLGTHDCPIGYDCRNTMGSFRCDRKRITTRRTTTTTKPTTTKTTTTTTTTTTTKPTTTTPFTTSTYVPLTTTTTRPVSTTYDTFTTETKYPYYRSDTYNTSSVPQNPTYISPQNPDYNSQQYPRHRFRVPDISPPSSSDTCGRGFHRNNMGACVDIDECRNPGICGTHERCINSNGSYRCRSLLQCSGGFKSSPDGRNCIDIDECVTGEHNCSPDQICRNRIGGYICSCPSGHTLTKTGNRCVDINECELSICPVNSKCINTIGSYYCECKSGFKKQNEHEKICVDIDECKVIESLCEHKCINYWGSYRCACNAGYEINLNNNRTCDDINECEVHKSYKLCMGLCNNVPGSYECSCPAGYELGTDKNSCRDIDECETTSLCQGRNDICTNIRGSYRCAQINCPYGYVNDPDQKNRCRIVSNICQGDDCYQKPTAITHNFITVVSKMLIPPQGRTLFTLRGPVWYENIDFDLKLVKTQAPANVEKASIHHFSTTKMRNEVHLSLMRSLDGPQDIDLELSMTVFMNGQPRGKSVAKILIIVSQYSF